MKPNKISDRGNSNTGFSLIEMMMAIVVGGVAIVTTGMVLNNMVGNREILKDQQEANFLTKKIEYALTKGVTCSQTFKNIPFTLNSTIDLLNDPLHEDINYYDDAGNDTDRVLVGRNMDDPNFTVDSMNLTGTHDLGNDLYAARLDLVFRARNNSGIRGRNTYNRSIGLSFKMANTLVDSCAQGEPNTDGLDMACKLKYGETSVFRSGQCAERYEYEWQTGTRTTASCSGGWEPAVQKDCGEYWWNGVKTCSNDNVQTGICEVVYPPDFWTYYLSGGTPPQVVNNFGGAAVAAPTYATPTRVRFVFATGACQTTYVTFFATLPDWATRQNDFITKINCRRLR